MLGFAILGGLVISGVVAFGVYVGLKAVDVKDEVKLKGKDNG
jgi:hypothetical protein